MTSYQKGEIATLNIPDAKYFPVKQTVFSNKLKQI